MPPTDSSPQPPLRIGSLELRSPYSLAPLAGHTNLPFRLAIRALGGLGLATTDMLNARSLIAHHDKTLFLAQTSPQDRPLAAQIYGPVPSEMAAAACWVEAQGFDAVDINMGCPARKVVRKGNGAAMMQTPDLAADIVAAVVQATRLPVMVKMRLGWDADHINAPELASRFEQLGVAGLTIHGRTKGQLYLGDVSLKGIRAVVQAAPSIPVLGNGNVFGPADALRMAEATGCAGIAIGRGALYNPFIFAQFERWERTGDLGPEPTLDDRLAFMERHCQLLFELRGEVMACRNIRKFAKYYRRFLQLPREVYKQLILVGSAQEFADRVAHVRSLAAEDLSRIPPAPFPLV